MADSWEKFLASVAVIDQVASLGDLTHGCLEHDTIESHAFPPSLPPVRYGFQDLGELRLRYPVTLAGFE
jgi:hypothetical protein